MSDANPVFREAGPEDWSAIWPILREVVTGGDTYAYSPDITEGDARTSWMHEGSNRRITYIAELGGTVVGTAYLRPNQGGPGDHVANAGWMISPAASGQGIGRRFAEYVIAEARLHGFTGMQFNAVVATNARAIALWESMGFEIIGTVPDGFRHAIEGLTAIHIMYREL